MAFWPWMTQAAGLELSITPTLFEMAANPSQSWSSQIKVINNNRYPITVYANVMNFAPKGEAGEGKFIPIFEEMTGGSTLAEWFSISSEPILIPPETSYQVPFTVTVPEDATPGGHFAAIMIGTKPLDTDAQQVSTSQIVTSLFFVRIAGDVIERGSIREFGVEKNFVASPRANFVLRFENKGNVHIQPQGDITIYNMWGKERGRIPINSQTHFGNVLPDSIRKFEFSWSGESSIADIGRYKAMVTLGYGLDARQFQTSIAYFYVVPVKSLLVMLVSLGFGIWFISWCIKAYVRRMLELSGVAPTGTYVPLSQRAAVREGDVLIKKRSTVALEAPFRTGFLDLKNQLKESRAFLGTLRTLGGFVLQYRIFFYAIIGIIIFSSALLVFFHDVRKESRDYEVTIDNPDAAVTLSSEDIIYDSQTEVKPYATIQTNVIASTSSESQSFKLNLINAGDTPGAAASLRANLEEEGYEITKISSDFESVRERTVIIYSPAVADEALRLSERLDNALLSALPPDNNTQVPAITVRIGNDYSF